MRRLVVAQSAAEVASLRSLWRELECAPGATLFQSFAWNLHAARFFDEQPFVVAVESDCGAALLPAALSARGGCATLLGDVMFDYRDALSGGDPQLLAD